MKKKRKKNELTLESSFNGEETQSQLWRGKRLRLFWYIVEYDVVIVLSWWHFGSKSGVMYKRVRWSLQSVGFSLFFTCSRLCSFSIFLYLFICFYIIFLVGATWWIKPSLETWAFYHFYSLIPLIIC